MILYVWIEDIHLLVDRTVDANMQPTGEWWYELVRYDRTGGRIWEYEAEDTYPNADQARRAGMERARSIIDNEGEQ